MVSSSSAQKKNSKNNNKYRALIGKSVKKFSLSEEQEKVREKVVRILGQALTEAGYTVRREELKRGFGWKVISGTCRMNSNKMIFVDRKLTLEDQVSFLSGCILQEKIQFQEEIKTQLHELGWKVTES